MGSQTYLQILIAFGLLTDGITYKIDGITYKNLLLSSNSSSKSEFAQNLQTYLQILIGFGLLPAKTKLLPWRWVEACQDRFCFDNFNCRTHFRDRAGLSVFASARQRHRPASHSHRRTASARDTAVDDER